VLEPAYGAWNGTLDTLGTDAGFYFGYDGISKFAERSKAAYKLGQGAGVVLSIVIVPEGSGLFKVGAEVEDAAWVINGTGNTEKLITVYRGTDIHMEQQVFDETGHLLSDSARQAYLDGDTLDDAYNVA
jgi:hypothetical protein